MRSEALDITCEKSIYENFVKNEVTNFLVMHNLQKINVDDGCGNKANVSVTSNGSYKVQTIFNELMKERIYI